MIPLVWSVRETLESVTTPTVYHHNKAIINDHRTVQKLNNIPNAWLERVRLSNWTVSLAINPDATASYNMNTTNFQRKVVYKHVLSAYCALKTVPLSFKETKVGLWYASGYRGTFLHVSVSHAEETSHKSDEAVSNATRKLIPPALIMAKYDLPKKCLSTYKIRNKRKDLGTHVLSPVIDTALRPTPRVVLSAGDRACNSWMGMVIGSGREIRGNKRVGWSNPRAETSSEWKKSKRRQRHGRLRKIEADHKVRTNANLRSIASGWSL